MTIHKRPFFVRNKIDWALILSAATTIIYLSSYLFQWGYNNSYGIPTILISLDWAKIFFSLIPIISVILINIIALEVIYSLFGYDSHIPNNKKRANLSLGYFNIAVLFSALISIRQSSVVTIGNIIVWLFFIISCFIIRFGSDKLVFLSPLAFLDRKLDNFSPPSQYKSILGDYVPHPSHVIIGILYTIIFGLLIMLCGAVYASIRKDYLVSSIDGTIVLNTFGDKAVVDKLGKDNILDGKIAVVDISQDKEFQVKQVSNIMTHKALENREKSKAEVKKLEEFIVNALKSVRLIK